MNRKLSIAGIFALLATVVTLAWIIEDRARPSTNREGQHVPGESGHAGHEH